MEEALPPSPGFLFVSTTQAEAATGRIKDRRQIRAHITKGQHAKQRSNIRVDAKSWMAINQPKFRSRRSTVKRGPLPAAASASTSTESSVSSLPSLVGDDTASSSEEDRSIVVVTPQLPTGCGKEDPFWTYPLEYSQDYSRIIAHYIQNVAVDNPDVDGPTERGLVRRKFFPLCMTEAAPMYAVLLMAASHYCTMNPSHAPKVDLLSLKARALREINLAVLSSDRATVDATIAAVAKLAAYEAIFGSPEVFTSHIQGLIKMVKLRGGFCNLGLDGLLERMIIWIEFNASHLLGRPRALSHSGLVTEVSFPSPSPHDFAGMS